MYKVLIDTCVWFDLAQDGKRYQELAFIEELIRRNEIQLLVPQVAIDEFHRNRESIAIAGSVALATHIRYVREFAEAYEGDKRRATAALSFLDELSSHSSIERAATTQILERIERLLLAAPRLIESESVIRAAVRRGVEKRAPFLDRNGMADALIIEAYGECIAKASPELRFAFITHNKRDFSQTHGNNNLPHAHLADLFGSDKSFYFVDLMQALRHIAPSTAAVVLERAQPTVGDLIEGYLQAHPDLSQSPKFALRRLLGIEISKRQVSKLKPVDFVEHTRHRRKTVVGTTAMHDFVWLKSVFQWAHKHRSTDFPLEILERARKAAIGQGLLEKYKEAPVRRLSVEDEQRLMAALADRQLSPANQINMVDVVRFALWSGRRRDEICRLRWEDFHRESQRCAVRDVWRKGTKLTFPLIGPALEIVIRRQKEAEHDELIFPYNSKSVGAAFTLVKKSLKLDITFDDLREEGLRRLVEAQQYPIALVQQLDLKKVLEIQAQIQAAKTQP